MRAMLADRLSSAESVAGFDVAVLIVSYARPRDVALCLRALSRSAATPTFDVFVAENGGRAAFDALVQELTQDRGPCVDALEDVALTPAMAARCRRLPLIREGRGEPCAYVHIAELEQNVGYAGGVNAWLRPLLRVGGWHGAWILNPDTEPEPEALGALVDYAAAHGKSLVGGRLVSKFDRSDLQTRGLSWRKLRATVEGVDKHSPAEPEPDVSAVERRLDAPSGASTYATREFLESVGLMQEHYFLYFEDLEWGVRAKESGRSIGYAHASIVLHEGGTTIGSSPLRSQRSRLSVYLDTRNRLLFVRDHHPLWLPWTIAVCLAEAAACGLAGSATNFATTVSAIVAALSGETGKPPWFSRQSRRGSLGLAAKKRVKLLISSVYWAGQSCLRCFGLFRRGPYSLVVLYYHGVSDDQRANFARQLASLGKRAEVVAANWPGPSTSGRWRVAITFDDGLASVKDNALPELMQRNMPCTIFFPSGVLGRIPDWETESEHDPADPVMDAQSVNGLPADLVTVGAHSINHPFLSSVPADEARRQIIESKAFLENLTGRAVSLFSFPYGDFNSEVARICQEGGFLRAYSIAPQIVDSRREAFVWGRVSVSPEDGPTTFYLKSAGAYSWECAYRAAKRRMARWFGRQQW